MKLIDNNGRLFGKISIIDVLVILVVAAMGAALYLKTNHNEITSTSTSNDTITYQVLVSGVRTYVSDAIRVDDPMYDMDRSSGGSLGTIKNIEVMEASKLAEFHDGTLEMAPMEDAVSLLLTVEGEGICSEGRYLLNRVYDLGVNSSRNFHTPYAQFVGVITAIG